MCDKKIEKPVVIPVKEAINEGKDLITLKFQHNLDAKPGQFVMLWIPRMGLKPFSVAYQKNDGFALTIFGIGDFTKELMYAKEGDKLGIQGPYGSSYSESDNAVLVGGGFGSASLAFLADELSSKGKKITFIIGARTKDYLLYINRFKDDKNIKMVFCTDDGSYGIKGFTTQALEETISKEKIGKVYTCGPEVMMKRVIDICDKNNIECEVSMERYMKCGFGVCGQCVVDYNGIRICKEGPVISKETVKKIPDFGRYKRDASGKKVVLR